MVALPPPPTRTPLADARGLINPVWLVWFEQFYQRVGGAIGLTPADIAVEGAFSIDIPRPSPDVAESYFDPPGVRNSNDLDVLAAFQRDQVAPFVKLAFGTYTPTLTNLANIDASTPYECQYLQVGDVVTVSGRCDADMTASATATQLRISLPIPSVFTAAEQCSGTAFCPTAAGEGAAIRASVTASTASMNWITSTTSNQAMYFTFTYIVIP